MKKIWVKAIPWDKSKVISALESGADAVMVEEGKTPDVKKLSVIDTVAPDGDIKLGVDVIEIKIESAADQEAVVNADPDKIVIVGASDWSIIPLENILARRGNIMAEVSDIDQARLFLGVLERGVDGLIINCDDAGQISGLIRELKNLSKMTMELESAEVTSVKPLGMGDRVCVDTCTLLHPGQGLLVGNSSQALFLVHAENVENPYVSQRPFRVNAGAVHAYVVVPGGKTRYLSELEAGDEVMAVDHTGSTQTATVGRVKIEKRPMLLVTAQAKGKTLTTVLQNAETIRLTTPEGAPISVVELKPGDKVLAAIEEGGRHFGHKVEESILEQ